MAKVMERIERLLFGATAEERAALVQRYIEQQVEQRLDAAAARLLEDNDTSTPQSAEDEQREGGKA